MPQSYNNESISQSENRRTEELIERNRSVALSLARAGFLVAPRKPDEKATYTRWKHGGASKNVRQVEAWWDRWPHAIPMLLTGNANGIDAIDLDVKGVKNGITAFRSLGNDPDAPTVITRSPSGGLHLYFAHQPDQSSAQNWQADGIDIRADDGLVVAPGAYVWGKGDYEEIGDLSLSEASAIGFDAWPSGFPVKYKATSLYAEPLDLRVDDDAPASGVADVATWFESRCDELAEMGSGVSGGRNGALNSFAFQAAQYGAAGFLDEDTIRTGIEDAFAANGYMADDPSGFERALANGLRDGAKNPRRPIGCDKATADDFDDETGNDAQDDGPNEYDDAWIDWQCGLGPKPVRKAFGGISLHSPSDCAIATRRPYVVKEMLAQGDLFCVFGDPGTGKSLIAPYLGYAVAQGREAFAMRTRKGGVLYIAAEDESGMLGRVAALRKQHGDAADFYVVGGVTDLGSATSSDLDNIMRAIKTHRPSLVIVDTMAMAFPGQDENSAEAMSNVVAVGRALTKYGAAVGFIHHGTKADGTTPRGHSLFNGALDMSMHLSRDQHGIVRGVLKKNRNGTCDRDIAFTIGVEHLGIDEDGDPITAAFAKELPVGAADETRDLTPTERKVLEAVEMEAANGNAPDQQELIAQLADGETVSGAKDRDSRRRVIRRAFAGLLERQLVTVDRGVQPVRRRSGFEKATDGDFDDLQEKEDENAWMQCVV